MPDVSQSVLVEFTPAQMFSLVDTVEDYPKFLPWCGGATLVHRDAGSTRATILINYRGIRRSFTTENVKHEPVTMQIRLVEGPFKKLEGSWRFTDLAGRGCKIEFRLHYEFAGRLLDRLISPVFDHIAGTLVEAYVKRAGQIYGDRAVTGDRWSVNKPLLRIEVAYALREDQVLLELEMAEGTTARQAVEHSGILQRFPQIDLARAGLGIFGRVVSPDTPLRDGDRVEIYRLLIAEPKQGRRERAQQAQRRSRRG